MIDLKKIEERCERANKGPWFTKPTPKDKDGWPTCSVIALVERGQGIYCQPNGGIYPANNQEFIAHSVTDLPALVDWIKRAKAILEMASIDSNGDCLSSQRQEEAKELLAELEPA